MTTSAVSEQQHQEPDDALFGEVEEADLDEIVEEAHFAMPAGFERVSDDVEAYWDASMGPLYFTPKTIRLMDGSNDDGIKSSALIMGVLDRATVLQRNAPNREDRVLVQMESGSPIGIWGKPGMRELFRLGGARVCIYPNGKRTMGPGKHDMQLFAVGRDKSGPAGSPLELTEDTRSRSLTEPLVLKLKNKRPPWWLDVYEDQGMAAARKARREEDRAIEDAPIT